MALVGHAEHFGDGISNKAIRTAGEMFDSGQATQIDETTFGLKIGNRELRGDGIVFDEDRRDFNKVVWRENDGEDFEL